MTKATQEVVNEFQQYINKSLDSYSKQYHNVDRHRFSFKQELIAKSGFWIAKKRYALWIINIDGLTVDKLDIKGIDVVRSNFAPIFRQFMTTCLREILSNAPKIKLDQLISDFKGDMRNVPLDTLAKPTSVKEISKYTIGDGMKFRKGTPAHVKAALSYNHLLRYFDIDRDYAPIIDKSKIKWLYLKSNPLNITSIAWKGYEDPDHILSFIQQYIDYNKIYVANLEKKIESFYKALNWSSKPTNMKSNKFFTFND